MKTGIQILDDFIIYISVIRNYSNNTIKEYAICIKMFFGFIVEYLKVDIDVKDVNVFLLSQITRSDVIAFLIYLSSYRNNSSNTRERTFTAIRCFFNWLYKKYSKELQDKQNPTLFQEKIESTLRLPKYLSLDEALKIQNIFNKQNSRNWERNNAILILFLNTGLRLSELINLDINNLDFKNKLIHGIICKGNKERTIFLTDKVIKHLKYYLDTRKDNNKALFVSSKKMRLSRRSVEEENIEKSIIRDTYNQIHNSKNNEIRRKNALWGKLKKIS